MKIRIIINTWVPEPNQEKDSILTQKGHRERAEVWRGDLDIEKEGIYLTQLSIIADGEIHPICDIPFSMTAGHYQWVPPFIERDSEDDGYQLDSAS